MLQDELKIATRPNHDELENLMFVNEIMNKSLTSSDYAQILSTNYIVHTLLEPKIQAALGEDIKIALHINARFKVPALAADLKESELDVAALDLYAGDFEPKDFTEAYALGALYVLEGATLGGNVIQKKLRNTPGFEDLRLNYYTVYKDELMNRWVSFVQLLNTTDTNYAAVIEGAKYTFDFIAFVSRQLAKAS